MKVSTMFWERVLNARRRVPMLSCSEKSVEKSTVTMTISVTTVICDARMDSWRAHHEDGE